jgi:hypothetical protein
MLWTRKDWTLKDLHLNVFKQLRFFISEWVDFKDPQTTKEGNEKQDLRKELPAFPYRPLGWEQGKAFTRADFTAMNLED